jgi:hypothetical protein
MPSIDEVLSLGVKVRRKPKKQKAEKKAETPKEFLPESIRGTDALPIVATFGLYLRTVSNDHRSWTNTAKEGKGQVITIVRALGQKFGWPTKILKDFPRELLIAAKAAAARKHAVKPALDVMITRYAPMPVDPTNRFDAAKHVIDGVARWLGVDDRHDHLVHYEVEQVRLPKYGVKIEIVRRR